MFDLTTLANGWTVGRFAALGALAEVTHLVTTRQGLDVHEVQSDRAGAARKIAAAMALESVAFLEQVHGNEVLSVEHGGFAGKADGLIADRPALGIMCVSADCPLILAADAGGRAVGVAHASWRGTVKQMASRLIARMVERYGCEASQIVACICPCAGPQRYEVGPDVLAAAIESLGPQAKRFFSPRDGMVECGSLWQSGTPASAPAGKMLLDLWAANRHQLLAAGVRGCNIHIAGICTMERNDLFPSYRIEGDAAGRFAAVVAKR
jgi:YfiH family protein